MYCHQEHSIFPHPPQQSEFPTVEAAPKFGGKSVSSHMMSPAPSTLSYTNALGGPQSTMTKELSAAAAADQLFAASNPPCPLPTAGCDVEAGSASGWVSPSGHESTADSIFVVSSTHPSVAATVPGSDSLFATTDSSKSRKRPAHVMETAHPVPVLPASPKRPAPPWFGVPPSDIHASRGLHNVSVPFQQANSSPSAFKPPPWLQSTRLSPTVALRSGPSELKGASWDQPHPQQFVSPSACHAKSPPTSQSPTSASEGLKSSMNQQPPSQNADVEPPPPPSERLPAPSPGSRAPPSDPNPELLKSPWWSLTNATSEVPSSLWETQQQRTGAPSGMMAPPSDRLAKMSVPRMDPFGTIRGGGGNAPLRLPGLPLPSDAQPDRGFEFMISAAQQTPQLPPLRPPRAPHQGPFPSDGVDDRCEVCWDNEDSAVNPVIQCRGCGVKVHQQCYGVCRSEPCEVEWYCALCLYWRTLGVATSWKSESGETTAEDRPPPLLYCVLCNRPKGAMKTGSEGRWVHVACVLYSQDGPTFRDVATRSNPINIDKHLVTHNRNRYSCSICRSADGYTTNCSFPGCLKRVHVACVFANGYRPKLQTITADVPLYPTAFLCQLPGSPTTEPTETRVVEKLVKIITCETHASENAYNAVELYEKKLLKKTDLSATAPQAPPESLLPPPLHAPFLPQSTADAACRPPSAQNVPAAEQPTGVTPPQNSTMLGSHTGASATQNRMPTQPAQPQQNMWPSAAAQPMYQQYPPPASSYRLPNAMFVPSAGYPLTTNSTTSPYYVHPWHVTPYSGYHAYRGGYGPQYGNIYPDGRTAQPGAYPNPYWPSAAYGSLLNRHHTSFSRVNGGGPRGACGINKSRTLMNRGEDAKSAPSAGLVPRKKEVADIRPVAGMAPSPSNRRLKASSMRAKAEPSSGSTSKIVKPAQSASLGPKQKKLEIASPRAIEDDSTRKSSIKTQRKKGSARGSSTTSGALASTTQRKESKNRGTVSRRKAEEDDDVGTATGHVIGAALSTRGFRINWAKIDPHFRSLRHISADNLLSSRISENVDQLSPVNSWSWILEDNADSSIEGTLDDQGDSTLDDLRSIWLDNVNTSQSDCGPEAPLTVVVSAKVPKSKAETETKGCEGAWTFWSMHEDDPKESGTTTPGLSDAMTDGVPETEDHGQDGGQRTPVRQANICEDTSSCHLTLSPSPFTKMRRQEPPAQKAKKPVHLHLMQGYALSAKHIACLRQRQSIDRRELKILRGRDCPADDSMADTEVNVKMNTSLLKALRTKACKTESPAYANGCDFSKLVDRVLSGHEDPTGARQESARAQVEQPKRKVTVDMANWNEIQRIESHLVRRFPVPPFFILLKKLPQEIGRSISSGPASAQTTTVQKFLAHRDSVSYTLDPAAPRRVVTASKKLYLHGRIWDLNPSFPLCETLFRTRLPEGSVNVSLPDFREALQSFITKPDTTPPIPIPDETSREWLASAQKVRLASNSQAESQLLTESDKQTASHGEDLIKILISESYWRRLMFSDDFVKRQALFSMMVWAKKHSRLKLLREKVLKLVRRESEQSPRVVDSDNAVETLKRQSDNASRWSAFRASILAGHQDPGSALVARVEAEHAAPASSDNGEGGSSTTGTASRVYFCLVCFGTELDNLNPLVTCARCGIKVHKNCYAIGQAAQLDLDILEWYCERCEIEKKSSIDFRAGTCKCALCLRDGGALRRFQGSAYIHITCAVWSSPLLVCGNLHKLSNWRFSNSVNVPCVAQARVCVFCVRAADHHTSNRRGARRRQPRDKVVRVSEDDEEMEGNPTRHRQHATDSFDDTPSPEFPLGSRGLSVKCAHENCTECFHPLCAWLRGLRVVACDDYLTSVAPDPDDPFLPGLEINAYCETHTPLYSPPNRLPIDVVSSHRIRAYLTREEEKPLLTSPVLSSNGEGSVIQLAPPLETPNGEEMSVPVLRSPSCEHMLPEHPSGGSRRPSLNQDLLQGILASVPKSPHDTHVGGKENATLAGKDVYSEEICQACLLSLDTSMEQPIKCPECSVTVHAECGDGVFWASDSVNRKTLHHMCTSCRLGGLTHCALCPRLGGALCEVSLGVLSHLLGRETAHKSHYTVHKVCLMAFVLPDHKSDALKALSKVESGAEFTRLWQSWLSLPSIDESMMEKGCVICGIKEGQFAVCSRHGCNRIMHISCAGIADLLRHSSSHSTKPPDSEEDEEPVVKRRRLAETETINCLCLEHSFPSHFEEDGAASQTLLHEHRRLDDLMHKLSSLTSMAEAVRDRQRKQRELFEQFADNMVGFGLTRLDASYGISYDHTSKISHFLGQRNGKNDDSHGGPVDEQNAKRATSSSATEAAPDSGSITEGGGAGDIVEGATESPAAAGLEELTSDTLLVPESRMPSAVEATEAPLPTVLAPATTAETRPEGPQASTTTAGMTHTVSEQDSRHTIRNITQLRSQQHTRRRSIDAYIDDFPSQRPHGSVARVDGAKVLDEAVVGVSDIRRHLDVGAVDVNHQLVSKESISQTTTASSISDVGRRKRKRTIVDAESDDEDEDDRDDDDANEENDDCQDIREGETTSQTPTPSQQPPSCLSAAAAAAVSKSPSRKADIKSERKRTAPPKQPPPHPPVSTSRRPRSKVLPSSAGGAGSTRTTPPSSQPKRRRVASLPLRNERGQFIRKANP